MKKTALVVAALAFGATTAFAQLESKKGEPYLPEAGDWAIGVDATPFLSYFGNLANGGTNGSFNWGWTNGGQEITGKMFTSETMAYRAGIRLGFGSNKWTNMVVQDQTTPPPTPTYVEDEKKTSWNAIGLSAGIEMRRGKTRLQGYYGGQFMFWMSGMKDSYTYGNAMDATNFPSPTTTDFNTQISQGVYASSPMGVRTTEQKYGSQLGFGVRGFIGAEYFVLPKISVGGEFGWGIGFSSTGAGTVTTQTVSGGAVTETTFTTGKSSSFAIDTDNNAFGVGASGAVLVHFHF